MKKTLVFLLLSMVLLGNLNAQTEQWDKVRPPGKWYEMKVGHFIIRYEEHYRDIAENLFTYTEAFYKDYKDIFKKVPRKIFIVIDGRDQLSNGFFNSVPPTIKIFPASSKTDTLGSDWGAFLLSHELLHYIHLMYPRGLGNVLSYIIGPIGRGIVSGLYPRWAIEGLAVTLESDLSSMGRYYDPSFSQVMRATVLLETYPSYLESTITANEKVLFGSQYSYGAALMGYIVRTYGYEDMVKVWESYLKFPIGFSGRHKRFMGKSLDSLHDEMMEDLEKKYEAYRSWSRGEEINTKDSNRAKYQILNESDAGILVLKEGVGFANQYMLYDPKGKTLKTLHKIRTSGKGISMGPASQKASLSQDGSLLVFQVQSGKMSGTYNDLYLYDRNKRRVRKLTKNQQVDSPVISNDNTYVYASQTTMVQQGYFSRLIRFPLKNSRDGYEVIYETPSTNIVHKTISPDGKVIVFVERGKNIGIRVQKLDIETNAVTTLYQRDYGLSISNLSFLDNEILSLVADIEDSGIQKALYTLHTGSGEWTFISKDKVGFYSGLRTRTGEVVYSSHNAEGINIFQYDKNEVAPHSIDIASIPVPQYFMGNEIKVHQDFYTIANPNEVTARPTPFLSPSDILAKERRIYGAIPSRITYYLPLISLRDMGGVKTSTLGYMLQFVSKNTRSQITMQAGLEIESLEVLYTLSYQYTSSILGSFTLNSKREYNISKKIPYLVYEQEIQNVASLFQSYKGHQFMLFTNVRWKARVFDSANSLNPNNIDEYEIDERQDEIHYSVGLAFLRTVGASLSTPLFKWRIMPQGTLVQHIDQEADYDVVGGVGSKILFPLARVMGIQFSNYTAMKSKGSNFYIPTERHRKIQSFFRSDDGQSLSLTTASDAFIESSFGIDIPISLYNETWGAYFFHPYNATFTLYTEQTLGYDEVNNTVDVYDYLVSGAEMQVSVALFTFALSINVGGAFRIPYTSDVDSGYYYYMSIGPSISDIAGMEKDTW